MINFSEVSLNKLIVHRIGNKNGEDVNVFSKTEYHPDNENLREILLRYYTLPFKSGEFFNLHHESDINLNTVYKSVCQIFDEREEFCTQSVTIAKHLYEKSVHPKIKTGEFCVVYFRDCVIEGELMDAVGLFKSETKDTFLKISSSGDVFKINSDEGININKIDKGCLIFNTEKDKGYLVAVADNFNRGAEAQYWRDDFLNVRPRNDNYHQTQNILNLCKSFVTDQLPEEIRDVSRADQADMLNKSLNFFKENESFNFDDFAEEVIEKPDAIKAFRNFKNNFEEENDLSIADEFDISQQAVKKQQKVFKSVIKLDKNFHIYVHGNRELIEKGFDSEKKMNYYMVYFKEEN